MLPARRDAPMTATARGAKSGVSDATVASRRRSSSFAMPVAVGNSDTVRKCVGRGLSQHEAFDQSKRFGKRLSVT